MALRKLNVALKTAIVESRKKQKRVAQLAHVSGWKLSRAVNGELELTKDERERLAVVLGKSVTDLFNGTHGDDTGADASADAAARV